MSPEFDLTHSNGIYIPHLSASTINSFIGSRANFYNSKVLRAPFSGSHYTCRGTAVEHAINTWLETGMIEGLADIALAKYDEEFVKSGCSKFELEEVREAIPGLVEVAYQFYSTEFAGKTAHTQRKIVHQVEGINRELLMYLDYFIMGECVRDCKTASKTPSSLSQAYKIQGALYNHATGLPVHFDFFIPNKKPVSKTIEMTKDDCIFGMSYLIAAAKAIEELEECNEPKRIIELMSFPNLDDMWTYSDKKKAAKQWGIAF